MAIQTINIGTTANDGTGDDPRTAGGKINDNFTNSTHAASRDVGTASGELPTADDLGIVGNTNITSSNFDISSSGGVGKSKLMRNFSGSSIAIDALIAGGSLRFVFFTAAGSISIKGAAVGTWKNTSSSEVLNNEFAEFTRIA